MATVEWNDLPALSQHHDFCQIVSSIFDHVNALEALYDQPVEFDTLNRNQVLLNQAASRNKSYYPSNLYVLEQASSPDDIEYRSRDVLDTEKTAEHIAYKTSWSVQNGQASLNSRSQDFWELMKSWGSVGPAKSEISLGYSRYWLKFNVAQDWLVIYNLCCGEINGNSRIKLSFCLVAAAYSKSNYAKIIVPFLIIFALDGCCHNLMLPPDPHYELSDGGYPEFRCLEDLVSESTLSIDQIPACFLKVEEETIWQIEAEDNHQHSQHQYYVIGHQMNWWISTSCGSTNPVANSSSKNVPSQSPEITDLKVMYYSYRTSCRTTQMSQYLLSCHMYFHHNSSPVIHRHLLTSSTMYWCPAQMSQLHPQMQNLFQKGAYVEMDICMASPRLDSLMLRGLVELAWTLLKGHLMLQDNYGLYTDIESTC